MLLYLTHFMGFSSLGLTILSSSQKSRWGLIFFYLICGNWKLFAVYGHDEDICEMVRLLHRIVNKGTRTHSQLVDRWTHGKTDKHRDRQTDNEAGRQMNKDYRQTDWQTDGHPTHRQMGRQIKQMDYWIRLYLCSNSLECRSLDIPNIWIDRQTCWQWWCWMDRRMDSQTDIWTTVQDSTFIWIA